MNILYQNNIDLSKVCYHKFAKMKFNQKSFDIIQINNINYFIKLNNSQQELDATLDIVTKIKTIKEKFLFINIRGIVECNKNILYISDKIAYNDIRYMVSMFNKKYRAIFLMQSLVSIYILNHIIGYYHNDIHGVDNVANIMIDDIYADRKKIPITFEFEGMKIPSYVNCIKMIDFEKASSESDNKNNDAMKMYFPDMPYVSEPLLFTYFYFVNYDNDYNNKLSNTQKNPKKYHVAINKIAMNIVNKANNRKDFDLLFIKRIYKSFSKYLFA